MKQFETLLSIAKRKSEIDKLSDWSNGSETYLSEIKNEIDEVIEELPKNRVCYLEDELGDVLWDYLNILINLEKESGVNVESILNRACKKFEERISGIENGELWKEIKSKQKEVLEHEQALSENR
jgi:NTP pyrophosphatase (non-canonical NTP hydrolase)